MTDWLAVCRQAVEDIEDVLLDLPTRSEREPVLRRGHGGDDTTAIDEAAEAAVVARFDATGEEFTLVSEELGVREGSGDVVVVLDPIDGSINAKRGIPFFSLSVAVAGGRTMDDVYFGYVHDFGTGEEWSATRGEGVLLDGRPLRGTPPSPDGIEILALEATSTALVAKHTPAFVGLVRRLRVMGSLAISLSHLASGRVDAVCSLREARSVDIAAAQLFVRECGYAIDLPDDPPFGRALLDLEKRSRVVAAGSGDVCARLAAALSA